MATLYYLEVSPMPQTIREGLLTRQELAVELGVSEHTLARWDKQGVGPPRTMLGRRIAYRREAIEKWLKDREQTPAPAAAPKSVKDRPKAPGRGRSGPKHK
jgi:predicted DNA-binding transcriptional regulator AlpA